MPIVVRTVYTLKRCASFDEAATYLGRIQKGAGRHKESEMEIQFDPKWRPDAGTPAGSGVMPKGLDKLLKGEEEDELEKPAPEGPWTVVVVNESMPPGGKPCAECDKPHFEDDFLCGECRAMA